jgi:hypothetical protein
MVRHASEADISHDGDKGDHERGASHRTGALFGRETGELPEAVLSRSVGPPTRLAASVGSADALYPNLFPAVTMNANPLPISGLLKPQP